MRSRECRCSGPSRATPLVSGQHGLERRGSVKQCLVRSNCWTAPLEVLAPYAVTPEETEKAGIARAGNSIGTKSPAGNR